MGCSGRITRHPEVGMFAVKLTGNGYLGHNRPVGASPHQRTASPRIRRGTPWGRIRSGPHNLRIGDAGLLLTRNPARSSTADRGGRCCEVQAANASVRHVDRRGALQSGARRHTEIVEPAERAADYSPGWSAQRRETLGQTRDQQKSPRSGRSKLASITRLAGSVLAPTVSQGSAPRLSRKAGFGAPLHPGL